MKTTWTLKAAAKATGSNGNNDHLLIHNSNGPLTSNREPAIGRYNVLRVHCQNLRPIHGHREIHSGQIVEAVEVTTISNDLIIPAANSNGPTPGNLANQMYSYAGSTRRMSHDMNFTGTPRNPRLLWQQDFEAAADSAACGPAALQGRCSLLLDAAHPRSAEYTVPARRGQFGWVQGSALACASQGEDVEGRMSQFVVRFCQGPRVVRARTVQFQRALQPNRPQELRFYVKAPREDFDHVTVEFLHFGTATVRFDNARLTAFDE